MSDVLQQTTASGFDFEPLPNGNILIEFFGDDGTSINNQVVTHDLIRQMPVVAALIECLETCRPSWCKIRCRARRTA